MIYEGHAFDSTATLRVSRALAVYAVGLGFFGLQKTLIPWFHAQNDMKTPLRVSVQTVVLNAVLNILAVVFLPQEWRHVGLAASTVVCAAAGCALLAVAARRRGGNTGVAAAAPAVCGVLLAVAMMTATLYAVRPACAGMQLAAALAVEIAAGAAVYLPVALVMRRLARKATAV